MAEIHLASNKAADWRCDYGISPWSLRPSSQNAKLETSGARSNRARRVRPSSHAIVVKRNILKHVDVIYMQHFSEERMLPTLPYAPGADNGRTVRCR